MDNFKFKVGDIVIILDGNPHSTTTNLKAVKITLPFYRADEMNCYYIKTFEDAYTTYIHEFEIITTLDKLRNL